MMRFIVLQRRADWRPQLVPIWNDWSALM